MTQNWLESCLASFSSCRVTVFGDFCLDSYWFLEPGDEERSIETLRPVHRVRAQRYSLGGAGNLVANLSALGVAAIRAIGLIGGDLFGREMLRLLSEMPGVDSSGMLQRDDWQTLVYCKPCIGLEEQDRIDMGGFNELALQAADSLATLLDSAAAEGGVVILNQQVLAGVSTDGMIDRINSVVQRHPQTRFIVDSRHRLPSYKNCMLKLNVHEACQLLGRSIPQRATSAWARELAVDVRARSGRCVFLTRGENGLIVADQDAQEIPGIHIAGPVDPVGAGDTALAAIAAVLAGGGDPRTAGLLANLAASITVRKLLTTGTANPQELRAAGPDPEYVYLPDLADDPAAARYLPGERIEIVRQPPSRLHIRHALFDHDGTLSTLRHGWEPVMAASMIDAITGGAPVKPALMARVARTAHEYIDKTTGIQTLSQMQGLVDLVRQFGLVPPEDVRDMHEYKRRYDAALTAAIAGRLQDLASGRRRPEDFEIASARNFLQALHARGVRLHLASGTDVQHVKAEAEALGYAHLFEGRVFGAVGDVTVEAKAAVLQRILGQIGLSGPEVLVVGDGPVEIRLGHRASAVTLGVASDETKREGLNPTKRRRLIRAGADMIVPDYNGAEPLLAMLLAEGTQA